MVRSLTLSPRACHRRRPAGEAHGTRPWPGDRRVPRRDRDWIAEHTPAGLAELTDWNNVVTTGGYGSERRAEAMRAPRLRAVGSELREARFICPQWPEQFGGKGLDAVRVAIFNEEIYRAGVPRVVRGMGESLVGPSVIVHGTPEQQAYFLPRIITGEDVYCQGFSEPGTGSDLAGLQTKGEIDGDEVVITGQKLWTSGAARANKMFVLCRTDPAAEKHAGISFVLIDFKDPAVSYQPVRQMSGAAEFCEDFLDGVRAPLFNVIGGLNNGWRVAMTTLGYERGGAASIMHLAYQREFWELVETARKRGSDTDPRSGRSWPGPTARSRSCASPGCGRCRPGAGPPAWPGGVDQQAVLERVPQEARRDRDGHRGHRRPDPAGGRRVRHDWLAERLPREPRRLHLLRH